MSHQDKDFSAASSAFDGPGSNVASGRAPGTPSTTTAGTAAMTSTTTTAAAASTGTGTDGRPRRLSLGAPGSIVTQGVRGRGSVDASSFAVPTTTTTTTATTTQKRASNANEGTFVTPHEGGDANSSNGNKKSKHHHDFERQALLGRLEGSLRTRVVDTGGRNGAAKNRAPEHPNKENIYEGRGDDDDDEDVDEVDSPKDATEHVKAKNDFDDNKNKAAAVIETMMAASGKLVQLAKKCYRGHEATVAERDQLQERLHESREEIDRLRSADEHNRKTIANLIRAKESALAQARAATTAKSMDGALRAELSVLADKYETSQSDLHESQRKVQILQGELDHTRSLFSKCKSDKAKLERDKRSAEVNATAVAAAAAQSGGGAGGGDAAAAAEAEKSELEFYKGKVSDLNMQLNRKDAVLAEKDRQLDEARRQLDRNALANHHHHHSAGNKSGGTGGTTGGSAAAGAGSGRGGNNIHKTR